MKRSLVFVLAPALTVGALLMLANAVTTPRAPTGPTPARAVAPRSTECIYASYFSSDDEGRVAKGTFENRCGRDVRIEYTLTGYTYPGNQLVIGPVRYTAYLKMNEAIPVYTVLNPAGLRYTAANPQILSVREVVIDVRPF